jgi:hypothetical protein
VEQVADGELRGKYEFNAKAQRREVAKKNNRNAVAAFSPALTRSDYAG